MKTLNLVNSSSYDIRRKTRAKRTVGERTAVATISLTFDMAAKDRAYRSLCNQQVSISKLLATLLLF